MISRYIPHKVANDNYRRLARYIADASHQGEKALMCWCAGCWSGDDEYELGIEEAELIQSLNNLPLRIIAAGGYGGSVLRAVFTLYWVIFACRFTVLRH